MTSAAARTDTAEQRSAIYATLVRRNRIVRLLRIGVPAIGVILVGGLMLQIYIANLIPDFGFANVTIDRDNLVVESPSYEGTGVDGSRYAMSAESARAAIGNPDLINLSGAGFSLYQADGSVFMARADRASLRVSDQLVIADGPTRVKGNSGMSGTVNDATVDILGEQLVAGKADLAFGTGATLKADTMSYDGKNKTWTFSKATLVFNSTPGEADYPIGPKKAKTLSGGEAPQ
jgi:lipopolysaccharide export system protein LptC